MPPTLPVVCLGQYARWKSYATSVKTDIYFAILPKVPQVDL